MPDRSRTSRRHGKRLLSVYPHMSISECDTCLLGVGRWEAAEGASSAETTVLRLLSLSPAALSNLDALSKWILSVVYCGCLSTSSTLIDKRADAARIPSIVSGDARTRARFEIHGVELSLNPAWRRPSRAFGSASTWMPCVVRAAYTPCFAAAEARERWRNCRWRW